MRRLWAPVVSLAMLLGSIVIVTTGQVDCGHWLSGTIRWASPTSWVVIDDAGHHPTGFGAIHVYNDHLQVDYDFVAGQVSSVQVSPDEAFTAAGVRAGASVGTGWLQLYFYMGTSQTPVNPALLTRAGANVWLTGWFDCLPPPT